MLGQYLGFISFGLLQNGTSNNYVKNSKNVFKEILPLNPAENKMMKNINSIWTMLSSRGFKIFIPGLCFFALKKYILITLNNNYLLVLIVQKLPLAHPGIF